MLSSMSAKSLRQQRKEDALELAQIIYDIFIEDEANANINNGQNDTNHDGTD